MEPKSSAYARFWMNLALSLAETAARRDEVPVGAVVVRNGQLLTTAFNLRESTKDACAHAEILAIHKACSLLGRWRLFDCELYVTLEPCAMCAGAIINARMAKIYYATKDPKAGAMGSLYDLHADKRLNHQVMIETDIESERSAALLKGFFRARRKS